MVACKLSNCSQNCNLTSALCPAGLGSLRVQDVRCDGGPQPRDVCAGLRGLGVPQSLGQLRIELAMIEFLSLVRACKNALYSPPCRSAPYQG